MMRRWEGNRRLHRKVSKKYGSTILLAMVLFTGLSLLLYPLVSDWWNSLNQTYAIVDYDTELANFRPADYTACWEAAETYNRKLSQIKEPLRNFDQVSGYGECLNVRGSGMMGYISIPQINVELPIYHGTSEGVLGKAVGHLEGTSLPVGGGSTHCVLSAHRGLPSARLFTDLDQIELGDRFSLKILDRRLTYEVFQILVVKPEEVSALAVKEGNDYCTLITCTPYGINSHRLLVQGKRIPNPIQEEKSVSAAREELPWKMIVGVSLVAGPILFVMLLLVTTCIFRRGHKRG